MENLKVVSIRRIQRGANANDIVVMSDSHYYEAIKQLEQDASINVLDRASNDIGLVKFMVVPRSIVPRECYEARYCIVKYIIMENKVDTNQSILIELKDLNEALMRLQQVNATVIEINTVLTQSTTHCVVHEQIFKQALLNRMFITDVKSASKDKYDVTVYVKDYDKTYTFSNQSDIAFEKIYDLVLVSLIEDAE